MKMLMRTSKLYKPISVRAAKFYYLIADLVKLSNMYQFTQDWFMTFFKGVIAGFQWRLFEGSEKNKERGMQKLRKSLTRKLFNEVAKTLFAKDVLLFAFLMAYYELESELNIDMDLVEFFIKGSLAQESEILNAKSVQYKRLADLKADRNQGRDRERDERRKHVAPWISTRQWHALDNLSAIKPFN